MELGGACGDEKCKRGMGWDWEQCCVCGERPYESDGRGVKEQASLLRSDRDIMNERLQWAQHSFSFVVAQTSRNLRLKRLRHVQPGGRVSRLLPGNSFWARGEERRKLSFSQYTELSGNAGRWGRSNSRETIHNTLKTNTMLFRVVKMCTYGQSCANLPRG